MRSLKIITVKRQQLFTCESHISSLSGLEVTSSGTAAIEALLLMSFLILRLHRHLKILTTRKKNHCHPVWHLSPFRWTAFSYFTRLNKIYNGRLTITPLFPPRGFTLEEEETFVLRGSLHTHAHIQTEVDHTGCAIYLAGTFKPAATTLLHA